ncbi:excalibur calcium-binding domain-containing protein [Sphingomonadaceae bacterium G21617-S1]|nr:excalibur calcium-binding domain-containing protein [Sphingomonadaceae bacterium G21617-S1]
MESQAAALEAAADDAVNDDPAPTAAAYREQTRPEPESEVYYANCSAARAAGAAPVYAGEPGYAPRLDRDGDGIGCE